MDILVIRFESFPYGNASSFRTLQLLKLAALCGHDITIISKTTNADMDFIKNWNCRKTQIRCVSVSAEYEDSYTAAVGGCLANRRFDLILKPTSIRYFGEINTIIRKYPAAQVYDSVEWYNASNWRLEYADPRYYKFCFLWNYVFPKADGIIAISRLIQKYYTKRNNNVVRIPTITDCAETPCRTAVDSEKIRFVFAGQLDKGKDNIDTFIEAMALSDPNDERIQLDVYGSDVESVRKHLGAKAYLLNEHKNILIHGRVPQREAQEACLNSDFSVFFRLNRRSANAGFPTKLGECMTFGTPAICNDTGDISLVVKNRINGYLLKTKSVDEIADVLRHILALSIEEREQMRREARKSAEEFFDYHNYQEEMKRVLENAVKGRK